MSGPPADDRGASDHPGLRIAVTGATGLIGSALLPALVAGGHTVVRVSRSPGPRPDTITWDPARGILDPKGLADVDAVVHLAGEPVDERWTAAHKRAIRESRIVSTALLARTLAALRPPPRVLVSASAIGYYGDRGDEPLDEGSAAGTGFLAEVGRAWEDAAAPARESGIRTVHPRFGIVLSRSGGALARLLPPFELGAGGKVAHGRQWMSWVARTDAVAALVYALEDDRLAGPVNVTAPHPVSNAEFAKTLGRVLHRPALTTIPAFALRLMYGELADEALMASQRAYPRALEAAGFAFLYPTLEAALRHELGKD
jgi:uncharacterized protein